MARAAFPLSTLIVQPVLRNTITRLQHASSERTRLKARVLFPVFIKFECKNNCNCTDYFNFRTQASNVMYKNYSGIEVLKDTYNFW